MALIRPQYIEPVLSDSPSADFWQEQLASQHPHERREAARALGEMPDNSATLIKQLNEESEPSVIITLITALALQADQLSVIALIDCLRSDDALLRNEAVEALKTAGRDHPQLLLDVLHDSDPDVRILAVNVLESLKLPAIESWLIEIIQQDTHINVCACAVDVLSEIATELSIEPLEVCRERFADQEYLVFIIDLVLRRVRGGELK